MPIAFTVRARDPRTRARTGELRTPHGEVPTPAFMPVGTQGTVKAMTPAELEAIGSRLILANTYHLHLRPGEEVVRELGGLHRFAGWRGAILTDSGGFQVFSLAALRVVEEDGVRFRSHLDGSAHRLTPESSLSIQAALGSDIAMALDVCPAHDAPRAEVERAVDRTSRWAERSAAAAAPGQAVFGIVQGGTHEELRARSAAAVGALPFAGFAVGGLSVGEPSEEVRRIASLTADLLPPERPRYAMGVGTPEDLLDLIGMGIDLFDCVLPTRNARNGTLFTSRGRVSIKRAENARDPRPLDPDCACETCRGFSRAYLRHLFLAGEILACRLHTGHNLHFYLTLMERARRSIEAGRYEAFRRDAAARLAGEADAPDAG
jgi:queuine tRNA-ribosyltransferase